MARSLQGIPAQESWYQRRRLSNFRTVRHWNGLACLPAPAKHLETASQFPRDDLDLVRKIERQIYHIFPILYDLARVDGWGP